MIIQYCHEIGINVNVEVNVYHKRQPCQFDDASSTIILQGFVTNYTKRTVCFYAWESVCIININIALFDQKSNKILLLDGEM